MRFCHSKIIICFSTFVIYWARIFYSIAKVYYLRIVYLSLNFVRASPYNCIVPTGRFSISLIDIQGGANVSTINVNAINFGTCEPRLSRCPLRLTKKKK